MPFASSLLASILLSAFAAPSFAQIPAGRKVDLATMLQAGYNGLKTDLTEAAALMPEADYASKPSKMADMRTYGEVIMHVAEGHFSVCAAAKGVPNPNQGKAPQQRPRTKADIGRVLADSFAFCDDVFSSLTEASVMEFVKQGQGEVSRGAILLGFIAHSAEMYGITTVYLRAKNIVPPGTARQKRR